MAAFGTEMFGSLTRRHAIKIAAKASVEECSLPVGDLVGHDKILSAARMNKAVVLFLETVELANEVIEKGVVIDGVFTPVLSLSAPSKKVIISNIPPFIKDEIFIEALSRHGKLVSPIRKIAISSRNPLLKHIVFCIHDHERQQRFRFYSGCAGGGVSLFGLCVLLSDEVFWLRPDWTFSAGLPRQNG